MREGRRWRLEWRRLWCDPWLRALVGWVPLLLLLWVGALFNGGLVRDLPVGLVDEDHSSLSRALARTLDSSPSIRLSAEYASLAEGAQALRNGEIYGLLLLPRELEKQVRQGRQPGVNLFYSGQMLLVGRLLSSGVQQTLGASAAQLGILRSLVSRPVPLAAAGEAVPVMSQLTSLYNLSGNYGQFLLAGMVPALWQILILVATISHFTQRLRRRGLQRALRVTPWRTLARLLLPLLLIYWGWGLVLWGLLVTWFGWPMVGSWGLLLLGQGLTVLACLAMGALLYGLTRDGARAMSLAAGYSAPAFAFMGVTFPTSDMDLLAQGWRALLPVSHYAELQIGQASLGLLGAAAWLPLAALLGFVLVWPLVVVLLRRTRHD